MRVTLVFVHFGPSPSASAESEARQNAVEQALDTAAEAQEGEKSKSREHTDDDTCDCSSREATAVLLFAGGERDVGASSDGAHEGDSGGRACGLGEDDGA